MAITVGVALVNLPLAAFVIAALPLLIVMSTRTVAAWILPALFFALAFRGLAGLGVAPGYAQFAHIPLAWVALLMALRARPGPLGARLLKWILLLLAAVVLSTLVNGTEPLRGVVYFLLLGEPFAIVAALVISPPGAKGRRLLLAACAVLVAIQIPLSYWQALTIGWGDPVQGTLYGSGAGAHVVAAVVIVGTFWYLARTRTPFAPWSIAIVACMAGIVLIADAKQVTFALPAVILAQRRLSLRSVAIGLVVIAAIFAVVQVRTLNQGYGIENASQALGGHSGKQTVALHIWHKATGDFGTMVFGEGPAKSVSRAAYQTLPEVQGAGSAGSSLGKLGLSPATTPLKADEVSRQAIGQAPGTQLSSFDRGMSSGIGVFGDLGLLGAFAYLGLFGTVFLEVRRRSSPEAAAAASGLAMLFVLGFLVDWWEEPPFTVFLGTLAGLALMGPHVVKRLRPKRVNAPLVPEHDVMWAAQRRRLTARDTGG